MEIASSEYEIAAVRILFHLRKRKACPQDIEKN